MGVAVHWDEFRLVAHTRTTRARFVCGGTVERTCLDCTARTGVNGGTRRADYTPRNRRTPDIRSGGVCASHDWMGARDENLDSA